MSESPIKRPQRIFITGGSGYIGSVIVKFAVAQGHTVHALSRSESSDAKLTKLGAVPVRGDITSLDVLRRESSEAGAALHLAFDFTNMSTPEMASKTLSVDDAAVTAMAEGLKESGGALVVSSGSLMAKEDPSGGLTTETSPVNPNPFIDRVRGERHALQYVSAGVRVCVMRLAPWVYGRGASGVAMLMGIAKQLGQVVVVGDGTKNTTTVHVDDAARFYLLVVHNGKAGGLYNVTSETDLTFREIADTMGQVLDLPVNAYPMEEAAAQLGPEGAFVARFLSAGNRGSNEKAVRELGWQVEERGILFDIKEGSYLATAKALKQT